MAALTRSPGNPHPLEARLGSLIDSVATIRRPPSSRRQQLERCMQPFFLRGTNRMSDEGSLVPTFRQRPPRSEIKPVIGLILNHGVGSDGKTGPGALDGAPGDHDPIIRAQTGRRAYEACADIGTRSDEPRPQVLIGGDAASQHQVLDLGVALPRPLERPSDPLVQVD